MATAGLSQGGRRQGCRGGSARVTRATLFAGDLCLAVLLTVGWLVDLRPVWAAGAPPESINFTLPSPDGRSVVYRSLHYNGPYRVWLDDRNALERALTLYSKKLFTRTSLPFWEPIFKEPSALPGPGKPDGWGVVAWDGNEQLLFGWPLSLPYDGRNMEGARAAGRIKIYYVRYDRDASLFTDLMPASPATVAEFKTIETVVERVPSCLLSIRWADPPRSAAFTIFFVGPRKESFAEEWLLIQQYRIGFQYDRVGPDAVQATLTQAQINKIPFFRDANFAQPYIFQEQNVIGYRFLTGSLPLTLIDTLRKGGYDVSLVLAFGRAAFKYRVEEPVPTEVLSQFSDCLAPVTILKNFKTDYGGEGSLR